MSIDKNSVTWLQVEEWAKIQIEDLRLQLEAADSEQARGRIQQLRALLSLVDPSAPAAKQPVRYAAH